MLKVLGNNILATLIYEEKRGGVLIPGGSVVFKKYHGFVYGKVVAVGPEYPYDVKPGDKILIRRHEGKSFKYEGKTYLKLKERWVDAIIV